VLFNFSSQQLRRGHIGSQVAKETPMSGKIVFFPTDDGIHPCHKLSLKNSSLFIILVVQQRPQGTGEEEEKLTGDIFFGEKTLSYLLCGFPALSSRPYL